MCLDCAITVFLSCHSKMGICRYSDAVNTDHFSCQDSQRCTTRSIEIFSVGAQVEYAATEYQLPRLTKMWTHLERQSGAGKMRGMGEKQIDVDRRLLRSRLGVLRGRLEEVRLSTACVIEIWHVPHKRDHGQALQ